MARRDKSSGISIVVFIRAPPKSDMGIHITCFIDTQRKHLLGIDKLTAQTRQIRIDIRPSRYSAIPRRKSAQSEKSLLPAPAEPPPELTPGTGYSLIDGWLIDNATEQFWPFEDPDDDAVSPSSETIQNPRQQFEGAFEPLPFAA